MISRSEIERLASHHVPGSLVLSVYLNANPAWDAGRDAMVMELKSRLHAYRERLDPKLQWIFDEDAKQIIRYLSFFERGAGVRSLAIFSDASERFFEVYFFFMPLQNLVMWEQSPFIKPLFEVIDETFAVVLADRAHAKLFFVSDGRIQVEESFNAEGLIRHMSESGMDHMRSQMNFQRKSEEHAHWHFKKIAEDLKRLEKFHVFHYLYLAGPIEPIRHLYKLLPKHLKEKVASMKEISVHEHRDVLLKKSTEWHDETIREEKKRSVENLILTAKKGNQARVSCEAVLEALQKGSVWKLFYTDDFNLRGYQCANCSALFMQMPPSCPYCGREIETTGELAERIIEKAFATGAEIQQVRGEAAGPLKKEGGIGAYLRYS